MRVVLRAARAMPVLRAANSNTLSLVDTVGHALEDAAAGAQDGGEGPVLRPRGEHRRRRGGCGICWPSILSHGRVLIDRPRKPASRASCSSAFMRASSSGRGVARASRLRPRPIAAARIAEWPSNAATRAARAAAAPGAAG